MGYNCSFAARGGKLEPYGDIAGPGVITGFLGTAWLAVIFVLLHYLFVFDPYENPFQNPEGNTSGEVDNPWRANPIDSMVKDIVEKGLERINMGSNWAQGLEMSILGMCDLQFVTGLGILISGFIDLPKGISAYHFFLVTHLAWFSNLTHICGLTVLRKYFHTRPLEKFIRIICMVILAIMLLAAIGPTLFFNWAHDDEGTASLSGTHAICLYDLSRSVAWHKQSEFEYSDIANSTAYQSGVMSVILLVLSLVSRTIKFHCPLSAPFKRIRNYVGDKNRKSIGILTDRSTETTGARAIAIRRIFLYSQMASSLTVRLYCDLVISTLSDLYWLVVSAAWGTVKLFMAKSSAEVDGNDWTFGQILPAFLVIGPIATAVKVGFNNQFSPLPASTTRPAISREQTIPGDNEMVPGDPDHLDESLEMRRFRQDLFHCLERDYYDISTCSWMIPVFCFMCFQILEATFLMFFQLVAWRSSAAGALISVFLPISMVFPTATHVLITACLLFEHFGTDKRKHVIVFSVAMSVAVLGLYSMLPIWVDLLSRTANSGTSTYGADLGSLGVSGYLFLIIFMGYLAPKWIFRKIPDDD